MAIWQFELTALEVTGQDDNGWPLVRLVHPSLRIDEKNMIRLYKTAKQTVRETFPQYSGIIINSFDRVDKKTGKDYGSFEDEPTDLRVLLNPQQQEALARIQKEIEAKILGDSIPCEAIKLYFGHDDSVKYLASDVACFYDSWQQDNSKVNIASHAEAKEYIDAIQRFYSRISPAELAVFCLRGPGLTPEELQSVRSLNMAVRS